MTETVYPLLVILLGVVGLVSGYRRGLARQVSGVLGVAFGIVCARLFSPVCGEKLLEIYPAVGDGFAGPFTVSCLSAGGVFVFVYLLFDSVTSILRSAMQLISVGMLDSLAGGVFGMFRYLLFVSLAYNLAADINPEGRLVGYARCHDGNVVEEVMLIAPALLDFRGIDELCHAVQLREASRIS